MASAASEPTDGLRRRGRSQRRVLAEDRKLDLAKLARRLDSELGVESGSGVGVDPERVALSTGSIQREHQLAAEPFSMGMLVDECFELGDESAVPSTLEVGVDT